VNFLDLQMRVLIKFLSEQKIPYVIIGGVAVSIHGEPRLTADIDANIILERSQISLFIKHARKYAIYPVSTETKNIAMETGVVPMVYKKGKVTGRFDLIIVENILERLAIERAGLKTMAGVKVRLISPEDLVIHKIASSRPRDHEDLRGILLRQSKRLDFKYIRYWLRKIDQANKGAQLLRQFNRLHKELSAIK